MMVILVDHVNRTTGFSRSFGAAPVDAGADRTGTPSPYVRSCLYGYIPSGLQRLQKTLTQITIDHRITPGFATAIIQVALPMPEVNYEIVVSGWFSGGYRD
jgi:hypothetical protein